jgi:hypothetical protein
MPLGLKAAEAEAGQQDGKEAMARQFKVENLGKSLVFISFFEFFGGFFIVFGQKTMVINHG